MSNSIDRWLEQVEQIARKGRLLISKSQDEHFADVVQKMKGINAARQGSKNVTGSDGVVYLVDIYVLPSGLKVLAGYRNPYI